MTRRTATFAALALASAAALSACQSRVASADCSSAKVCLPGVAYQDIINHEVYPAESLKGKVVVVNFWATWCPPCKKEIPAFNRVYARYKSKGVVMLGVLHDQTVDENGVLNFMSDNEFTYPVVKADPDILLAYEYPSALPSTFVYDKHGKLAEAHRGEMTEADLTALLDRLLKD